MIKPHLFIKHIYPAFILLSSINFCLAQNTDSLELALKKIKADSNKINPLNALAAAFINADPDKSLNYAEKAKKIALQCHRKKGYAVSLSLIGKIKDNNGDGALAMNYYNEALAIFKEFKDTIKIISVLNNIGGLYNLEGKQLLAIKCYLEILALPKIKALKKEYPITLHNLAGVYGDQKNYTEAIKLETEAMQMADKINAKATKAYCLLGLADDYAGMGRQKDAIEYNLKSLNIAEQIKNKYLIITNLLDIGCSYIEMKQFKQAFEYHSKGLKLATEIGDQYSQSLATNGMGLCYIEWNEFSKGIALLNQSLAFAKILDDKKSISSGYCNLADAYEKEKNFQAALKYSKLYKQSNDSLYNEENSRQINELSAKYESEKKEKEISQLNIEILTKQKDKEILNARVKEKNSIILAGVAACLLLILGGLLLYSRQQMKQKNIHQAELSKQQENMAMALIQAQENERNRIAQDLHDGIGTFLSTLKVNLQSLENFIPNEQSVQYKNTSLLVDKTSVELRNIIKDLSSETLQEQGLESALYELTDSLNRSGSLKINFLSHGLTARLEDGIEINLFRVAQELLTNTIKHAQATQATLQLIDHGNILLLMLEDNGKGFEPDKLRKNKVGGMGLKNIRNRINFIKGTLKIESVIQKGSTFIIEIPKKRV